MDTFIKDPNAEDDYKWDWSAWLGGDTIATSEFLLDTTDMTVKSKSIDGNSTIVRLAGGVNRKRYLVTNRVTTASGRINDRSITLRIAQL